MTLVTLQITGTFKITIYIIDLKMNIYAYVFNIIFIIIVYIRKWVNWTNSNVDIIQILMISEFINFMNDAAMLSRPSLFILPSYIVIFIVYGI